MKRIGRAHQTFGFTLVGLLAILAVLALLAVVVLARLSKLRSYAVRATCGEHLREVGVGFQIWANDHDKKYPMSVSTNMGGTLEWVEGGKAVFSAISKSCRMNWAVQKFWSARTTPGSSPVIPVMRFGFDFEQLKNENLSYFVGLDADKSKSHTLLAGDRNITNGLAPIRTVLKLPPNRLTGWTEAMHNSRGNIVQADGSVLTGFTTLQMRDALKNIGDATNRIALPE